MPVINIGDYKLYDYQKYLGIFNSIMFLIEPKISPMLRDSKFSKA